jgi:hypothetical protein
MSGWQVSKKISLRNLLYCILYYYVLLCISHQVYYIIIYYIILYYIILYYIILYYIILYCKFMCLQEHFQRISVYNRPFLT